MRHFLDLILLTRLKTLSIFSLYWTWPILNYHMRGVQGTRQPPHTRPATTWSDNSGGWTRVPTSLNLTLAGWFASLLFQNSWNSTCPKFSIISTSFQAFWTKSSRSSPDPMRSCRYLTKSRSNLNKSNQIPALMMKPETDLIQTKIDETLTGKSNEIFWVDIKLRIFSPEYFRTQPSPTHGQPYESYLGRNPNHKNWWKKKGPLTSCDWNKNTNLISFLISDFRWHVFLWLR